MFGYEIEIDEIDKITFHKKPINKKSSSLFGKDVLNVEYYICIYYTDSEGDYHDDVYIPLRYINETEENINKEFERFEELNRIAFEKFLKIKP